LLCIRLEDPLCFIRFCIVRAASQHREAPRLLGGMLVAEGGRGENRMEGRKLTASRLLGLVEEAVGGQRLQQLRDDPIRLRFKAIN
jgi:hypothetical protein